MDDIDYFKLLVSVVIGFPLGHWLTVNLLKTGYKLVIKIGEKRERK